MQTGRTFRVFVSSTFEDLKAERNALQDGLWKDGKLVKEGAFPRLRRLCEAHGARFQAVDLRWGVSEEASLDQQTMPLCLGEIERSQRVSPRPNFIVLLGNRYGWRPLPCEIPTGEFEHIRERACQRKRVLRLLERWYRLDDNAAPPVWLLQPRIVDCGEAPTEEQRRAASEEEAERWRTIERRLRRILYRTSADLALTEERRLKYLASATEQEIVAGALQVEDARQHVFCFFRTVKGLPRDAQAKGFRDLDAVGKSDLAAQRRLRALKWRLREHVPGNVFKYLCLWGEDGASDAHLGQLCDDVYSSLEKVILKELEGLESVEPLAQEITAHEAFAEERTRHFRGRAAPLGAIAEYLHASDPYPLVVWGESGTGKSALMAKAVERAREAHGSAEIVCRFVGVTPASSNGHGLLESLCRQIDRAYEADEGEVPADYGELVGALETRLAIATDEKPLLVFLDALDQLREGDPARRLSWLTTELPENVRLVVSSLPGDTLEPLEARLQPESLVELGPMKIEEAGEVLDLWLTEAGRALQEAQRFEVLGKFEACPRPLYLKLAFEEARHWRSHDALEELSDDIPAMVGDLFDRLAAEANHGERLVERSLGYLGAAKNGLTEDELLTVLSADAEVMEDFRRRSPRSPEVGTLPVVVWSRLHLDLEPYLAEWAADGTTLLNFYHRQVQEAVADRYLAEEEDRLARHRALADHFGDQAFSGNLGGERVPNLRKLSELPYQQAGAALAEELQATLLDFDFLQAKVEGFGPQPLIDDFDLARSRVPESESLELVKSALQLSAHILQRDPRQTPGQLLGRLLVAEVPRVDALLEQIRRWEAEPWLCPVGPSMESAGGPLRRSLTAPGGVRSHCDAHHPPLLMTRDGRRAVCSCGDGRVRVWDLRSGDLELTLEGGRSGALAVAVDPDGRRLVTGGEDGTIKLWDLRTGQELRVSTPVEELLPEDEEYPPITSLSVTPDGRRILSGDFDGNLCLWDLENLSLLEIIKGNEFGSSGYILLAVVLPDGRRAVSVHEGYPGIKVLTWDLEDGKPLGSFSIREEYAIIAVAVSPDGRRLVTADGAVKVWDLETGREIRAISPESEEPSDSDHVGDFGVRALALTPDGRQVLAAGEASHGGLGTGGMLRIWETDSGVEIRTIEGHDDVVWALICSADGKHLLSGSADETLKLWDLSDEREMAYSRGHATSVATVDVHPDRIRAASASWRTVKLWSLATGRELAKLEYEGDPPRQIQFSPEGGVLVLQADAFRAWNAETGEKVAELDGRFSNDFAFAFDRRWIAVASEELNCLKVWDLQSPEEPRVFKGPDAVFALALTPDDAALITLLYQDPSPRVWDLTTGELLATMAGHKGGEKMEESHGWVSAVAATPDGKRAVVASYEGSVGIWELSSGVELSTLRFDGRWVAALAITEDGERLICGCNDGTIEVVSLETSEGLFSLEGHERRITSVAATSDGRRAVTGSYDGAVRIWDLVAGRLHSVIECPQEVNDVLVSADGLAAVAACEDGAVRAWNIDSGALVHTFMGHAAGVETVAVTPNDERLVSWSGDGALTVWDLLTGDEALAVDTSPASAIVVTRDGRRAIAGSTDGTIRIWDLETGRELEPPDRLGRPEMTIAPATSDEPATVAYFDEGWKLRKGDDVKEIPPSLPNELSESVGKVKAFALDPGQRRLVTSVGHEVTLWNAQTKQPLASFSVGADVESLAISPDGETIVVGAESGRVHFLRSAGIA